MAPSIKLTYFDFAGRGEPHRLTMYIGGIDFEDDRLSEEQFAAAKKVGALPLRSLPVMTVKGQVFAESSPLLRYVGKLAGLYPKDDVDAMKVDMVVDGFENILVALFRDMSEEGGRKLVEETFPRYVAPIEKMYEASAGPFLLDGTMTVADVKVAHWTDRINAGKVFKHYPPGVLDKYESLIAVTRAVLANEKVKEWRAAH